MQDHMIGRSQPRYFEIQRTHNSRAGLAGESYSARRPSTLHGRGSAMGSSHLSLDNGIAVRQGCGLHSRLSTARRSGHDSRSSTSSDADTACPNPISKGRTAVAIAMLLAPRMPAVPQQRRESQRQTGLRWARRAFFCLWSSQREAAASAERRRTFF